MLLTERNNWLNWTLAGLCIAAVAVLCVTFNGGISVGASNHVGMLPVVRRILDPGYLPDDFNISLRLFHHRVFAYLLAGLSTLLGEARAIIVLHVVGAALLSSALWFLCRTLTLSWLAFLTIGMFLATGFCGRAWAWKSRISSAARRCNRRSSPMHSCYWQRPL